MWGRQLVYLRYEYLQRCRSIQLYASNYRFRPDHSNQLLHRAMPVPFRTPDLIDRADKRGHECWQIVRREDELA